MNKMAISTYQSAIITLNVNRVNSLFKRHRAAEWIKRQCLAIQDTHFRCREGQTESEEMEKDIPCKWKPIKVGVTILISDKIDFKTKTI